MVIFLFFANLPFGLCNVTVNFEVLSVNTVMEFADKGAMIVMVFVFFSPVFGFMDMIL